MGLSGAIRNTTAIVAASEAALELEDHVDGLASLHVVRLNSVFVGQRLTLIDKTNHSHVDSFTFLQGLLNVENRVRWLEVERLLHTSKGLK